MNAFAAIALLSAALFSGVQIKDIEPKDAIQRRCIKKGITSLDVREKSNRFVFPRAGVVRAYSAPVVFVDDAGVRRPISTDVKSSVANGITTWHARSNVLRFDATSDGRVRYWLAPDVGVRMRIVKITQENLANTEVGSINATSPTVALPKANAVRWSSVLGNNVTIDYTVSSGRIKEIIKIDALPVIPPTAKRFAIIWQWQAHGLTPTISNKAVEWTHSVRGVLLKFDPVYVYDAVGTKLRARFILRGNLLGVAVNADDMRTATYPVYIDPTATAVASDSVLIGEYAGGGDINVAKVFIKFSAPDMTGNTVTAASVYVYGTKSGFTDYAGTVFCDVVSAWTSATIESTLNSISFGSSTGTIQKSALNTWHSADIYGAAGYGLSNVYDNDITGGTVTVLFKDRYNTTVDDKATHELALGTWGGTGSAWQSDTDANPPYIEITYTSGGLSEPGRASSGSAGVLMF